jgi:uncharacterized protein
LAKICIEKDQDIYMKEFNNEFKPEAITTKIFTHLRKNGWSIGVNEYIAALDAIRGGIGTESLDKLKLILELLWCHSLAQQSQFTFIWQKETADLAKTSAKSTPEKTNKTQEEAPETQAQTPSTQQRQKTEYSLAQPTTPELAALPVRTPFVSEGIEDFSELRLYFPVTRRSLTYLWRYLRRPIADGPLDVLDIEATIKQATQQGFYLAPAYRRREMNHAHLVVLVDQDGSMTPFHRFTRDLVETAQEDSTIENVSVYYFHNIPSDYIYRDSHLTTPVELEKVLAQCDSDTSVLLVSDAGAARGYRRMERIRATTEFLVKLKQRTSLICWLNPMPKERWESSSAEVIGYLVPMEQMNDTGMSNAIDVVRGL